MEKRYIIADNHKMLFVARSFQGKFRARDYIDRVTRDYFGKYPCYGALIFDHLEQAKAYLESMKRWYPDTGMRVHEYDACSCNAGKAVL